jgi:hypothetical protein
MSHGNYKINRIIFEICSVVKMCLKRTGRSLTPEVALESAKYARFLNDCNRAFEIKEKAGRKIPDFKLNSGPSSPSPPPP